MPVVELRNHRTLEFRVHAIEQMFERRIRQEDVRAILDTNDVIEENPDAEPNATYIVLGSVLARPLHVVAADVPGTNETIVTTVYDPKPERWHPDLRTRRIR